MQSFISYDVSARQNDVKSGMLKKGYSDNWVSSKYGSKQTFYLPNTSLWKDDTELETSISDLKNVISGLNSSKTYYQETIKLLRCISTSADPWAGIPGDSER